MVCFTETLLGMVIKVILCALMLHTLENCCKSKSMLEHADATSGISMLTIWTFANLSSYHYNTLTIFGHNTTTVGPFLSLQVPRAQLEVLSFCSPHCVKLKLNSLCEATDCSGTSNSVVVWLSSHKWWQKYRFYGAQMMSWDLCKFSSPQPYVTCASLDCLEDKT